MNALGAAATSDMHDFDIPEGVCSGDGDYTTDEDQEDTVVVEPVEMRRYVPPLHILTFSHLSQVHPSLKAQRHKSPTVSQKPGDASTVGGYHASNYRVIFDLETSGPRRHP